MKFKVFTMRLAVEESSIEAESYQTAAAEVRSASEKDRRLDSQALRFVLKAPTSKAQAYYFRSEQDIFDVIASPPPKAEATALLRHYADEIEKSRSILSALAYRCLTPEDLAIEQERDIDEVLASRDYEDEFDVFMKFIVFARRALNEADIIAEVATDE